jgi:predicted N-acetyltransferase YhbS
MKVVYKSDAIPDAGQIIELYNSSGINRPTTDKGRIAEMYAHSNLIITAWDNDKIVGVSRSLTDFCYCCYLSDLAVRKEYQKLGIGKELIRLTQKKIGPQTTLILFAAPSAMEYYPKAGFQKAENAFVIKRTK